MAQKISWFKVVARFKKLIEEFGNIYPEGSTPMAGYGEDGPYHCEDCSFLRGQKAGNIYKDEKGMGRCIHAMMVADKKVKKDEKGIPIVDIERGCCAFNDQRKD